MARRYSYTKEVYVDAYAGREDSEILESFPCTRCGGTGGFEHYKFIDNGVCYRCNGDLSFTETITVGDRRLEAQREVKRVNKCRMQAAKAEVLWAEGIAALAELHPEWATVTRWEGILEYEDGNEFVRKLATMVEDGKPLSEKQAAAGAKAIDQFNRKDEIAADKAAAHAAVPAVEAGHQEITGTVVSIKRYEDNYSFTGGMVYKFLIVDEQGRKFFGTMPNAAWDALEPGSQLDDYQGRTVTLTATVAPGTDDHAFGKYSRPSKFSLAPLAS